MSLYRRFLPYGVAIASTAIAAGLSLWVEDIILRTIGAFFYIAIAFSTWYGGLRPGLVAMVLSLLAINYYFIPPKYQFVPEDSNDTLRLFLFLLVALIITLLSANLRQSWRQVEQLNRQLIDESSDRLKAALNAAQMGLWDWDMVTGAIAWSPEHEQLFGLPAGSFDGRYETFDARLHPEDREGVNQEVAHALQNKVPYHQEYRVIWLDGSVHWIEGRGRAFYNEAGEPVRLTGTVMAIDQRKQAEGALQERESLLWLFARYAPAGIAMFDRQMRYVMASQRWVDEYQLTSVESIMGRSHYDIFPEISDHWRQIHQRCLAGAIEKCDEDRFVRADGTSQWISWEVRPWYTASSAIGGIIIFSVDVTQKKQNEFDLQALNAELEQRVIERTQELQQTNDFLSNFFNAASSANIGLCIQDQHLRFVRINETLAAINGHSVAAHLGRTPTELLPELAPIVNPLLRRVQATGQPILNLEIAAAAPSDPGPMRHWLASYFPLGQQGDEPQITGVGAIVVDITYRKQAEATLKQQTAQKQLLWTITQSIRQSLDLEVILKAAVTDARQLLKVDRVAIYRFNPNWSGDFVVESVAEGWVNLVEPNVCKVWQDTYLQETQGGRFQNHETFIVSDIYTAGLQPCHIDLLHQFQARAYAIAPIFVGQTLWGLFALYHNADPHDWAAWEVELLEQIAFQLAIAIQQAQLYSQLHAELQERQQTEAVLREAERRWRSLLDNVQLIVVGLDQSGKVSYVNPFFLNLTGYRDTEVLGKSWFENFVPLAHQKSVQAVFAEGVAHKTHPYYQNFILTKSGEERFIAWNNTLLQGFDSRVIGTISIGEDITERQRIEQMKNEFIGIVSHELRTPLTAIQMSLGLVKTGIYAHKPEKSQRMIEIALTDTNRLVNLVNDILDLERLESGRTVLEKTVCQAMDLMEQAVQGVQAIANQQHITLAITPTAVTVWAAPDMIVQTLTNLLSNALKFSPPNSTVWLKAESGDFENLRVLATPTPHILFTVTDQGRGIPEDKLETIFGRFQQVDVSDSREKGGTGLGLSICRSIIERHNGKIWAESVPEKGSTFFFTLPLPPNAQYE